MKRERQVPCSDLFVRLDRH